MKISIVVITLVVLIQCGDSLKCYTCLFPTLSPMDCIKFPVKCPPNERCLYSTATGKTSTKLIVKSQLAMEIITWRDRRLMAYMPIGEPAAGILASHRLRVFKGDICKIGDKCLISGCTTAGTPAISHTELWFCSQNFPFILHERSCAVNSLCGISGEKRTLGINVTYHNVCCDTDLCNSAAVSAASLSAALLAPVLLLLLT